MGGDLEVYTGKCFVVGNAAFMFACLLFMGSYWSYLEFPL